MTKLSHPLQAGCCFVVLFVALFILSSLPTCTPAAPQYFMTVSTAPLPTVAGVAETLSLGDDAPFAAVSLSFNFPFYQPTRYLWIDPNGALHMHAATPPCCLYSPAPASSMALPSVVGCSYEWPVAIANVTSNGTVCTLDTSIGYTDLIAPSLLDLNPSQSPGSVQYVDSGSALLVRWVDVPWWTYSSAYNTTYYSFEVLLSIDGTILFHYTAVTDPTNDTEVIDPALPPITRTWLVGVRQEAWRDTETTNAADYSTTRPGLYPPKQWVTDGSTVRFCPIDTAFCMWPTDATLHGTTLVLLTSANMTCASVWNHTYSLSFTLPSGTTVSSEAVYDRSANTLQALTPAVAETGVASVTLEDTTANATVQFATPLYITFHASGTFNRTTIAGYCMSCAAYNPYYCTTDCAGVYLGTAVIDACGQCIGGTTNATYNSLVNCAGTCGLFTTNWTVAECLCEQLQYPPVVSGWSPGNDSTGEYVGPVSYYVQRKLFDVSVCGLDWSTDDVFTTLLPLHDYQALLMAATSLLLLLAVTQAMSVQFNRPLASDPFQPGLYMSEQPPAVVVEAGGEQPEARQDDGAAMMNEPAVEAGSEAVGQESGPREEDAAVRGRQEQEEKEATEDAGMSLAASELWRRRQSQLARGRQQLTAEAEEKQQETPQPADKVARLIEEATSAAAPSDVGVQRQSAEAVAEQSTTAQAALPTAFLPPRASPFAPRR